MKNKHAAIALFMSILLLVMSSSAFAAEDEAEKVMPIAVAGMEVSVAALRDVEVEVTVPAAKNLYINPLGFPVKIGDTTDSSQILTDPAYIENRGESSVSVNVSITGSISEGSTMTLSSSSTKDLVTTGKKAFIYFEIKAVSDPENVAWDTEYDIEKHVPVRVMTKTRKHIIELDEAGGNMPYGAFRLTGDCVKKPKIPWTKNDSIKAVIAFTFKPIIEIG